MSTVAAQRELGHLWYDAEGWRGQRFEAECEVRWLEGKLASGDMSVAPKLQAALASLSELDRRLLAVGDITSRLSSSSPRGLVRSEMSKAELELVEGYPALASEAIQ